MLIRQEIEQAIVALEAQRAAFMPEVAEIAIGTLRAKLATFTEPLPAPHQSEGAILIADMSGFTSLSEFLDAEEVRDMINAVWQKLDGVIDALSEHRRRPFAPHRRPQHNRCICRARFILKRKQEDGHRRIPTQQHRQGQNTRHNSSQNTNGRLQNLH